MIIHRAKPYDKNRFIALNAFRFFPSFFDCSKTVLQTAASQSIQCQKKRATYWLTHVDRWGNGSLASFPIDPCWVELQQHCREGLHVMAIQTYTIHKGYSLSKLFGFYYTTNKEITNQNYSSCHYELAFELCICIDIIL